MGLGRKDPVFFTGDRRETFEINSQPSFSKNWWFFPFNECIHIYVMRIKHEKKEVRSYLVDFILF